ncbi:MAG: hypothetical protein KF761_14120 [Salinibacterium sp.]|nr:hypothetical protein [Salinibacterium sp.]
MTDPELRLPSSTLRAVLSLGGKRAATIELPPTLNDPELAIDLDEESGAISLFVAYETGELHCELHDDVAHHHFHLNNGKESDRSPWSGSDTETVVQWATLLMRDFQAISSELLTDVTDAAAWHDEGFDLYVCQVEGPIALDLLEVTVEGDVLTLPWLGAGRVDHDHIDGDGHPIALLWSADDSDPTRPIAEARLDLRSEDIRTKALPGVDWDEVGLPRQEVLDWLEGIYFNHHVKSDAEGLLLSAALRRMGGID